MASISVEFKVFHDPRFKLLAKLSTRTYFDAIGRMAAIWMYCIEKNSAVHQRPVVDALADLEGYSEHVLQADLAELTDGDLIRIKGTSGRIEYLEQCRRNAPKGGRARAETATRSKSGQFVTRRELSPNDSSYSSGPDGHNPADRQVNHQPTLPAGSSPSTSTSISTSKENTNGLSNESQLFQDIYNTYPKRDGSQRKKEGMKVLMVLFREGKLPKVKNAIENYRSHCQQKGLIGTDKVQQFKTFLSNSWEEWVYNSGLETHRPLLTFGDDE